MPLRPIKNSALLLLMCLSAGNLYAQSSAIGGLSAAWVNIVNSARIEGMGEAYTAVSDNVDSFGVNPGSLGKLTQSQLSFTHNVWIQGASIEQMMGSLNLGKKAGNLAFDFTFGNYGDVDKFSIVGGFPVQTGTFQPMTWMASLGYGIDLFENISLGFSGKFMMDDLDNNQKYGFAGDAGMAWSLHGTGFTLGASVLNIGSLSGATIPTEGRAGMAYLIKFKDPGFMMTDSRDNKDNKFLLSVDGVAPLQDFKSAQASIGAELWYHDVVALRVGQQLTTITGLTGLVGFSAGVGLREGPVQVDYAFATRGDLGNINMISLLVRL